MWENDRSLGDADRGASEILGIVLLLGLVLGGAMAVVVMGSGAITEAKDQHEMESALASVQQLDATFGSFGRQTDDATVAFDLGNVDPGDVRVVRTGSIAVTANDDPNCQASIPLSSIRYEDDSGRTVAYEAGGVWRAGETGSAMVSAPDVSFQNGTLSVSVVDVVGDVNASRIDARMNATRSEATTQRLIDDLYEDDCQRPDNLTMSVQSDFDVAWADYLRGETGQPVTRFEGNDTVRLSLSSDELPVAADDAANQVINLSQSPTAAYMDQVEILNDQITVNKSVKNTFTVTAAPLHDGIDVGDVRDVETSQNVRRKSLDLVFIMDRSLSMNDGYPSKLSQAKSASKGFLADLDSTVDRAGLVGYTMDGYTDVTKIYLIDDEKYLSNDFSDTGVNGTIDRLGTEGGTNINRGIDVSNELYDYFSDQNRDRVAILLTDGVNDHPDGQPETDELNASTIDKAKAAARNDVTIYTVGFSSSEDQVADDLLRDVADITGGEYYYAADGDELGDRFGTILESIQSEPRVTRAPITTSFSTDGEHPPTIAGDSSHLARDDSGGTTYLNVNDPTAPSLFGHSFPVSGGESVDIGATEYDCDSWAGTSQTVQSGGDTYQVARCASLDESSGTTVPTTVYTDGDDASPLLSSDTADWQTDMGDQLDPYLDGSDLDLKSNQAIIAYDFDDSVDSDNLLLVLYEVGLPDQGTRAEVFEPRVHNVSLDG
ncbi:vWA domain-containing protein [Halorientalis halophila]|uniref:vWA domain-containing protein n=1 Tax=Halorientalis halophila TaxID=3108499 RepID=UPI00300AED50